MDDDEDATNSPLISVSCLSLPSPLVVVGGWFVVPFCNACHRCIFSPHHKQTNTVPWMTVQFKLLSIDKARQCLCPASKDTPVRRIVGHVAYRLMAKSEKVYRHPLAAHPRGTTTTEYIPVRITSPSLSASAPVLLSLPIEK